MKLFIVHGWTYNLDKWSEVSEILKNRGAEPILLKVPGLTEPSDKVWDINGYCEWLAEKLKGESTPIVVGHSNGGRIAMNLAVKQPGLIGKLILVDSAGVANTTFLRSAKLKVLYVLSKIGKPLKKIPLVNKVFYKLIGARDYMDAKPNMRATMQNMLAADKQLDPKQVKLPTTIIWGREDSITPLNDGLKLHKAIENSELHIIDGARHAPMATHAEQVADLILKAAE